MLSSERVEEIFSSCLFTEEESENEEFLKDAVFIDGIKKKYRFNTCKVEKYSNEISGFLNELRAPYKKFWSFRHMWEREHGIPWTYSITSCEKLVSLGILIGRMQLIDDEKIRNLMDARDIRIQILD